MEFSEPISEMEDLEGDIYDPESVIEVLTLAHAHCVPSEDLGFRVTEDDRRPIFDDGNPADDLADSGEPQPVQETPADGDDAEALDEDRVIPFMDDSMVTIDGVVYSLNSSLVRCEQGAQLGYFKARFQKGMFQAHVGTCQN